MKKFRYYYILLLVIYSCEYTGELEIIPVEMGHSMVRPNHSEEYFLLKNYNKNERSRSIVDSFICRRIDSIQGLQTSYYASFYKETKLVNAETVKKDDDNLYTFGQHLISYRWRKVNASEVSRTETFSNYISSEKMDSFFECE